MLSCGEGGVRGGISSGLLGEEAATAEARDQLLAAEELLPISPYISLYLPISPSQCDFTDLEGSQVVLGSLER